MKHISILVPAGSGNNLSSIAGTYKIFSRANEYRKKKGRRDFYKIELAGISKRVEYFEGLFSVKPHKNIASIRETDLVIIPSLNHDYVKAIRQNKVLVEWIADRYRHGSEIASICTGAFLLAATGLMTGRKCSTHWAAADHFRTLYPEVNLQADKLITDEHGIYTSGGAYSFLNLVIYLVEKYFDRETAIFCSKVFQVDMDRSSQSPFSIFAGQKTHGDDVVVKAQDYIESRIDERISIEQLSSRFAVGRRNFDRRFIKATGNTPLEYAQRVKMEAAKKAFENSRKTINEVMYDVGYADVKAFREVFRKITGMSPLEYRKKYNKDAVVV